MEIEIGATDLRQKLTDVLQAVREDRATYIIETFGRPQAVLIGLEEYQAFRQYQEEREAFFRQLEEAASANSQRNTALSEEEILALIEGARAEVVAEQTIAAPAD